MLTEAFKLLEIGAQNDQTDGLFQQVELIDNNNRNNNQNSEFKRGSRGTRLSEVYLSEIFQGMMGAENTVYIRINTAFRIGYKRRDLRNPQNILVKFVDWTSKKTLIDNFREQGGIQIEGSKLKFTTNLSSITLRCTLKFLTNTLTGKCHISYRWGFPFK